MAKRARKNQNDTGEQAQFHLKFDGNLPKGKLITIDSARQRASQREEKETEVKILERFLQHSKDLDW